MKRSRSKLRIAVDKESVLCLFLLAATAATPLSIAQACQASVASESACCRAMRFTCHHSAAPSSCCQRDASAPAPGAVPLPVKKVSGPSTIFTLAGLLPPASPTFLDPSALQAQMHFGGNSPPGNVPIFLLHSTLLI